MDPNEPYVSTQESEASKRAWIIVGAIAVVIILIMAYYFLFKSGKASDVEAVKSAVLGR